MEDFIFALLVIFLIIYILYRNYAEHAVSGLIPNAPTKPSKASYATPTAPKVMPPGTYPAHDIYLANILHPAAALSPAQPIQPPTLPSCTGGAGAYTQVG